MFVGCVRQRLKRAPVLVSRRYVFSFTHGITPDRTRLGWLTVAGPYFLGVVLYQVLLTTSPVYLRELFDERDPGTRQSARLTHSGRSSAFQISNNRMFVYRISFTLSAMYFWDGLPASDESASIVGSEIIYLLAGVANRNAIAR